MIKKFTRPFMSLVLLLSSKAFCNQMPSKDMPDCSQVDLIEQSMPNSEDALRNCCKEKCKKCKCEKFCKLLVSKNLKTESLSVVKNATVGGNLAVTGSTTLNGSYPVLNQYEQVYNIRGLFSTPTAAVSLTLGSAPSSNPDVYPITISPSNPVSSSGQGFTVSNMTGLGYYYANVASTGAFACTILNFSTPVTFDKPFAKTPSVVASVDSYVLNSVLGLLNNGANNTLFLNSTNIFVYDPSPTGFTTGLVFEIFSEYSSAPAALPDGLTQFVNGLLQSGAISFIVDGVITTSAPVCPACPTVKPCCR